MSRRSLIAAAAAALVYSISTTPVVGHHSFAQFDMTRTMVLNGTVRTLEWTNPHVWLWVDVSDGQEGHKVWGLEGAALGEMSRRGWSREVVKPGDKITVEIHPLRDGRSGGSLGKVTLGDGRILAGGQVPGAPAADGPAKN